MHPKAHVLTLSRTYGTARTVRGTCYRAAYGPLRGGQCPGGYRGRGLRRAGTLRGRAASRGHTAIAARGRRDRRERRTRAAAYAARISRADILVDSPRCRTS